MEQPFVDLIMERDVTTKVLLLMPSSGLGGGIERYAETLISSFTAEGIYCCAMALRQAGWSANLRLLTECRKVLRAESGPVRIVLLHRALLPIARVLAQSGKVTGISVVLHGSDVWNNGLRIRRHIENHLLGLPMCAPWP